MVVIILENVPVSLRGELTRWLIEPHPGVFVGHVSGMVRDLLWTKCCAKLEGGGALILWSANNEQRFRMDMFGYTKRHIVSFDGLQLIRVPNDDKKT